VRNGAGVRRGSGSRVYSAAMILAGIDEAGYGPVLGPLVVGCCAFEVTAPDTASDESKMSICDAGAALPCLWKMLRKHVSRSRSRNGRKLHVNDSKSVYSPNVGLKELERSVLALAACAWPEWDWSQPALLGRICPSLAGDLPGYAWYAANRAGGERSTDSGDPARFPIECDALSTRLMVNALRQEMSRAGLTAAYVAARVVLERELNRMLEQTRNKAASLFSVAAVHIDQLMRAFGDRDLVIVCDRQGGREHYGALLRLMFDEWSLEVVGETAPRSEYRLMRSRGNGAGTNVVRIIFCERAESISMPVAYASMISKYLRESLMRRFNAFWRSHLPELQPTAGYYNDGLRFLRDIQSKRAELGIEEKELVRCR
jgi:hypothetical protein